MSATGSRSGSPTAAGADGGGEFLEQGVGFSPVDAGVGDALAVDERLAGDEGLGAGAAIARHAQAGDHVSVLFLTNGTSAREGAGQSEARARRACAEAAARMVGVSDLRFENFPDNAMDTVPLLQIVKAVECVASAAEPEIVYLHHAGDLNIDHAIAARATLTCFRPLPGARVKKLLAFEVPSSTGWDQGGAPFVPNLFLDAGALLETKLMAVAAYGAELRDFPHARSLESIRARAVAWGTQAGLAAAHRSARGNPRVTIAVVDTGVDPGALPGRLVRGASFFGGAFVFPGGRVDDDDRGVHRGQRLDDVRLEVGIAGGVDDGDPHAFVLEGRDGEVDALPALLLLGVVVKGGRSLIHAPQAADGARVEEHGLGEAGLPRAAVPDQGDVADVVGRKPLHQAPPRSWTGAAGDSSGAATCCAPVLGDTGAIQGMVSCQVRALLACPVPARHPAREGSGAISR